MGKVMRHTLGASLNIRHNLSSSKGDRKSGSAGLPRPTSYAVFCLQKKNCLSADIGVSCQPEIPDESYRLSLHDALPISPTASISKESPAITGVVEMVIRRPI